MRTQDRMGIKIKRIVHSPGRVVSGNIQSLEIIIIAFDFRAFSDLEADLGEQV